MTIESACTFTVDCPHSTPKFTNDGVYCIDTTCIKPMEILWDKIRRVSEEQYAERNRRMVLREGDIIFSREGTIGTAVKVPANVRMCMGQRVMMLRFASFVRPSYAEMFLASSHFINQYRPLILRTSSPHLNVREIKKLSLAIPPLEEQDEIIRIMEQKLETISEIEHKLSIAKDLKARMMNELSILHISIVNEAFSDYSVQTVNN